MNATWVMSQYLLGLILNWLITEPATSPFDGPLGAVYVGLYIPPTGTLTPLSTLANITEATYAGYARQLVAWYPPYIANGGNYTLEGHSLHFTPTDGVTPNQVVGVFLADALNAGHLLCSAKWPLTGAPLVDPTTALTVDAFLLLPATGQYGGPDLTN